MPQYYDIELGIKSGVLRFKRNLRYPELSERTMVIDCLHYIEDTMNIQIKSHWFGKIHKNLVFFSYDVYFDKPNLNWADDFISATLAGIHNHIDLQLPVKAFEQAHRFIVAQVLEQLDPIKLSEV